MRRSVYFLMAAIVSMLLLIINVVLPEKLHAASAAGLQAKPSELSESAKRQIAALLAEKESRTQAQQKIDSQLLYALRANRGEAMAPGVPTQETDVGPDVRGMVLVDIRANVTKSLIAQMRGMGADIVNSFPNDLRASLPLNRLEEFANLEEISFVRPAAEAITDDVTTPEMVTRRALRRISPSLIPRVLPGFDTRASRVRSALAEALYAVEQKHNASLSKKNQQLSPAKVNTSEGDVAHRADQARTIFGINGSGVNVGVLSNGVDSLATLQGSGDLPAGVTVLSGQAGSGDEGSAMLEIVFDLAPGANLFFATGGGGPANFANNIRALRTAGCDIIVDDVFYLVESAAPITQSNDPGQCGAVVNYPPPTATDCGVTAPTCAPASGTFFATGTTTVTCTTAAGPSCTFTVTVNDTEKPTITCPGSFSTSAAVSCPIALSKVVTYANPTVNDNCPGVILTMPTETRGADSHCGSGPRRGSTLTFRQAIGL